MARRSPFPTAHRRADTLEFMNFKGGLCTVRRGLNLERDELEDVLNFKYVQSGRGVCLKTREGLKKLTTVSALGAAAKDMGYFVDSSGTGHVMAVANSTLYEIVAGAGVSRGILEGTRGRGCQFAGKWIVADGGRLKQWDGTNLKVCVDTSGKLLDNTGLSEDGSTSLYSGSTTRAGQKVTVPDWAAAAFTIDIETARFRLAITGSPTGSAYAKIYSSGGSLLATSDAVDVATLATSPAWQDFEFSTPYAMVPGTEYYFTVEFSGGDVSNYLQVYYSTAMTGTGVYSTYNGSWTGDSAKDCLYHVSPGLAPKASIAVEHFNRIICNDLDEPNKLNYSNLRDPNDWSAADAAGYIYVEAGTTITAIKQFYSLLTIHLGLGRRAVHKLTGSGPDDYALSDSVMTDVSAINQDCCFNIGNDLLFVDLAGLVSLATWERYGDLQQAIKSDKIENLLQGNISSNFAGHCPFDSQFWLDVGSSEHVLVYDARRGIWTKYWFELGAGVVPTFFSEWNGTVYVGDSAGNIWYLDQTSTPQYTDGDADYAFKALCASDDFGVLVRKHARRINVQGRTRTGGSFDLVLYKDLNRDAFQTLPITVPLDPDVTVNEATMDVDDADWSLDDEGGLNLRTEKLNFEFTAIQASIENVSLRGTPLIFQGVQLYAAALSR